VTIPACDQPGGRAAARRGFTGPALDSTAPRRGPPCVPACDRLAQPRGSPAREGSHRRRVAGSPAWHSDSTAPPSRTMRSACDRRGRHPRGRGHTRPGGASRGSPAGHSDSTATRRGPPCVPACDRLAQPRQPAREGSHRRRVAGSPGPALDSTATRTGPAQYPAQSRRTLQIPQLSLRYRKRPKAALLADSASYLETFF